MTTLRGNGSSPTRAALASASSRPSSTRQLGSISGERFHTIIDNRTPLLNPHAPLPSPSPPARDTEPTVVAPPLQAPKNKLAHVAPDPNRARFEAAGLNGRRIYTLFANCNNDRSLRDSYYNWIAEWRLGSPRIHCELYFPDGFESFPGVPDYVPNGPASFSVTKQHGATWTFHKDFLNIEWETLMHTVTPTQYERVRVLLNDYKGMPFDHFGFLMGLFFKNAACTSTDHAFCSRVIAEVYGDPQVGLLTREECESPYEMTPPLLYNLLAPRSAVNAALPTRIRHIRNTEGNVFFSQ